MTDKQNPGNYYIQLTHCSDFNDEFLILFQREKKLLKAQLNKIINQLTKYQITNLF